jgi:3-oxoacyl-[acyl-carrier-protein] synthase III
MNGRIGIERVATYLPQARRSNHERAAEYGFDTQFIESKIGVDSIAVRGESEDTSDLCVRAFENLARRGEVDFNELDLVVVVTQNPDTTIPHTSAIVHGKLGLPGHCGAFDISLGCSGYVCGLQIVSAMLDACGMRRALLFTADPYSKVVVQSDRNTAPLFGDAAAVSLLGPDPVYKIAAFAQGTSGDLHEALEVVNGELSMNGRMVFEYVVRNVPPGITELLQRAGLSKPDVARFLFHQGSKYIVESLQKLMKLSPEQVPFSIRDYGNTVSSSIPFLLENELTASTAGPLVLAGFGVGLSWAGAVLQPAHPQ